jgi:hypothetical protein
MNTSPAWGMTTICDLLSNTCKKQTQPFEALLVQWIKTGWNDISAETMVKRFKKCKVSNDMNEREEEYEAKSSLCDMLAVDS